MLRSPEHHALCGLHEGQTCSCLLHNAPAVTEEERLRAVLVHVLLDIEEWRSGTGPAWSGTVLDAIERRAKAALEWE